MENKVLAFKPRSGYEDILFFLNGLESDNTRIRYGSAIERFIKIQYDIPMEHIQPHHFQDLTYTDLKKYRDDMKRNYSATTVNSEMTALYSLLKELNRIERDGEYVYSINVERIKVKPLKVTEVNSSGDVTWEEVDQWIQYLKESTIANKELKIAFFHLARVSGLRKEALANLTYRDLCKKDGNIWQLSSTLKGKTKHLSLKDEDAEMLLNIWKNPNDKDEKILKMSTKTMERLMKKILEEFNVPEERNITVHSLRGLSIYEAYLSSNNDILVAQDHANHSNMETTYGYIQRRQEAKNQPSLYMGEDLNEVKAIHELSQEQWIEVYKELSRSAKYEVLKILDRS